MSNRRAFYDEDHERAFEAGRERIMRGGPDASICGAQTRLGGVCRALPIREGKGRCLRHAGPHAARAHRERQLEGFLTGRVSPEVWNRAEARRAANKLSRAWRKDPWTAGATIDLGAHEDALRADLAARGVPFDLRTMPPAVADWLRWQFRRRQIDRRDTRRWEGVLRDDLPRRIKDAGPPPAGGERRAQSDHTVSPAGGAVWGHEEHAVDLRSKRQRADMQRVPPKVRGKGYGRPGRPRTQPAEEDEMTELMAVYRSCADTAAPMLARCRDDGEGLAFLRALRDFFCDPNDPAARDRWMEAVQRLRPT